MSLVGGFGEGRVPDQDEVALFTPLKEQVEANTNATYSRFEPVLIKSQVVAGTNYWVKVQTGDDTYIHIKVFKPLPHT